MACKTTHSEDRVVRSDWSTPTEVGGACKPSLIEVGGVEQKSMPTQVGVAPLSKLPTAAVSSGALGIGEVTPTAGEVTSHEKGHTPKKRRRWCLECADCMGTPLLRQI